MGRKCLAVSVPTRGYRAEASRHLALGSNGEIIFEGVSFIFGAKAAAALQLRHQKIGDVQQIARCRDRMRDHETTAAAGCFESLLKQISHLFSGARNGMVIRGRGTPPALEELLARDLGLLPDLEGHLMH